MIGSRRDSMYTIDRGLSAVDRVSIRTGTNLEARPSRGSRGRWAQAGLLDSFGPHVRRTWRRPLSSHLAVCATNWPELPARRRRFVSLMDCATRFRIRNPSPAAASHFAGERRRPGGRASFWPMSSAAPVEEPAASEARRRPSGDSFIRRHLRTLAPYQPILPFEVCMGAPQLLC